MSDPIDELRRWEPPAGAADRLGPADIVTAGRRRRRRTRSGAVSALAVLVAAGAVAAVLSAGRSEGPPSVVAVATADRTFDGMTPLACDGTAPLSALTAKPGVEDADTPEAAGLRSAIREWNMPDSESPEPVHGWVLLGRFGDKVSFGHRQGAVGVDSVITLQRRGNAYEFAQSGGCGPIAFPDGRTTEKLGYYTVDGRALTLHWDGGTCDLAHPHAAPLTFVVHENAGTVSILGVDAPPDPTPGVCAGVGVEGVQTVTLATPLAGRVVEDLAYYPSPAVPSLAETEAAQ